MADNNSIMNMVRRFAGADPETEDTVLEMCYRAAVAWYEAAGVPEDPENELWLFWACNLAAWMYDNRGNADGNAAIPLYIVTSVHQLRPRRNAAASGTGTNGTGTAGTDTGTDGTGTAGTDTGTEAGTAGTDTGTEAGEGA